MHNTKGNYYVNYSKIRTDSCKGVTTWPAMYHGSAHVIVGLNVRDVTTLRQQYVTDHIVTTPQTCIHLLHC